MNRIFLDANVLFSAAYREDAGVRWLWQVAQVELITSDYAAQEARTNLAEETQRQRLNRILRDVRMVPSAARVALPDGIILPEKDRPILMAAVEAQATHLLTGDKLHFGRYFGRAVAGVLILTPSAYLASR